MRALLNRRPWLAVVSLISILLAVVAARNHFAGPWSGVGPADMRRVLLNGIAVTHPEYYVAFDEIREEDLSVPAGGGDIYANVSALSPWPIGGSATDRNVIELGAEGYVGLLSVDGNHRVSNALGKITAASEGFPEEMDDRDVLANLEGAVLMQAIVTLKTPLTEQSIRSFTPNVIDTVFFGSERTDEKFVAWPMGSCDDRGITGCSDESATPHTEHFQKWVSQLSSEDDLLLSRLDLDGQDLRKRAAGELAWAYIVSLRPADLRDLAADPHVAGCTLVGVQLDI